MKKINKNRLYKSYKKPKIDIKKFTPLIWAGY